MSKTARRQHLRLEALESRRFLDGSGLAAAGEPAAPDFALMDVNPTSPSHNQTVQLSTTPGSMAIYFLRSF